MMQEFKKTTLYKKYINVVQLTDKQGNITPVFILWDNGLKFKIEKVLQKKNAASQVGGGGVQYRVKLENGQERYLYYEINRWFMESEKP